VYEIALVGCPISLFRRRTQAVSPTDQRRKQYKLGPFAVALKRTQAGWRITAWAYSKQ
jgi:hypothetical protein